MEKVETFESESQHVTFQVDSPSLEFELFKTLTNIGFYLLVFPYKVIFDPRRKFYRVATFRLQQIPCLILQALTMYYTFNELRDPNLKSIQQDPRVIFTYSIIMSHIITTSVLFSVGWCCRKSMGALVDCLQKRPSANPIAELSVTSLSTVFWGRLICLLLSTPGFMFLFATKYMNRKWIDIYRDTVIESRTSFGFLGLPSNLTKAELWSPLTIILTPLFALTDFHRFVSICTMDVMLLVGALIAFRISKQFLQEIKNEPSTNLILLKYKNLKSTFSKINDAIGTPISVLLFTVIPYYSSSLVESLEMGEPLSNLLFLLYFVYYGVGLILASEANRNANYMRTWLCEQENFDDEQSLISNPDLQILLYDLNVNQIGIKGPGGIFTITYGLLGTLMSLVLTYSVIMVQFQSTVPNGEGFQINW